MEPINQAVEQLVSQVVEFLPRLITAIVVFILFLILAALLTRGLRRTLERRSVNNQVRVLLTRVTSWAVIITGVIVALQQVDFDVTAFLAGLGVVGFTIGFAVQDVSKNFIAGLLLLLSQPFSIEDNIKVGEFSGIVKMVDLRATEIRAIDGTTILIPNAQVFTSPITNYSRASFRRIELNIGVADTSDLEKVQQVTLEALNLIPSVSDAPKPSQVIFNEFGSFSINCIVYYWVDNARIGFLEAKDKGIRLLKEAYAQNEIELPYPIQTIHLANH
jgi:small conductance mechanosensitive channel